MTIQRAYTATGLPAYLIVVKSPVRGNEGARELIYPRASNFDRLWAIGEAQEQAKLAEAGETE